MAKKMIFCTVKTGDYVFKQGDNASYFFIIESGEFQVSINNENKKILSRGDGFGELALLYGAPRSADILALGENKLYAIGRNDFRKILADMNTKDNLTDDQQDSISRNLIEQRFKAGEFIVIEGETATSFYVLLRGEVEVLKNDELVRKMVPGDCFGEQAFLSNVNSVRTMSIRTTTDTSVLALAADKLIEILGDDVQNIFNKNRSRWAIQRHHLLSKLSRFQQERILINLEFKYLKENEKILDPCRFKYQILILLSGDLKFQTSTDKILNSGECLFFDTKYDGNQIKENLFTNEKSQIAFLKMGLFEKLFGGNIDDVLSRVKYGHEVNDIYQSIKDDQEYNKSEGRFGRVLLCKCMDNNEYYAVKAITKSSIIKDKIEKHVERERISLQTINFPFLITYVTDLEDKDNIYFVLELIYGLELFHVIREIGILQTYEAKFYTSTLVLVLEFLHSTKMIYRDLKPENIMTNADGFLTVVDLGTVKVLENNSRTFTTIGTPHYISPEVYSGKGYSFPADLWSLGIILYEFMCGFVPFGENESDPYKIYEAIIFRKNIQYPLFVKDKKAKHLMEQLLNKNPERRAGGSYANLKNHPWFFDIDWDKLLEKKISVPYKPSPDKLLTSHTLKDLEIKKGIMLTEYKIIK